jgi:hypothetical protein
MKALHRLGELLEVRAALRSPGGGPGLHDRGQDDGRENGDDRDHDEEFHERQARPAMAPESPIATHPVIPHDPMISHALSSLCLRLGLRQFQAPPGADCPLPNYIVRVANLESV